MKAATLAILAATAVSALAGAANPQADGVRVDIDPERNILTLHFSFHPDAYKLKSNNELKLTPLIVGGDSTFTFAPIVICGRNRRIMYERGMRVADSDAMAVSATSHSEEHYSASTPLRPWFGNSTISITATEKGCCDRSEGTTDETIAIISTEPEIVIGDDFYVLPEVAADEKYNEICGSAFIDFPVNRTEIHDDYRRNSIELARIIATIDTVKSNPDASITDITIKGYASPEGSYANNERLAIGRTKALTEYVRARHGSEGTRFHTAYEPEDWEGLRLAVEASDLPDKEDILAAIDTPSADLDRKEQYLRHSFPRSYAIMLDSIYPSLRHSDYTVRYKIRQYSDPEEIKRVFATTPANLSLHELMILAGMYEPGSEAYGNVVMTAVRMHPDNETLNMNAAAYALNNGDHASARYFLSRCADNGRTALMRARLERTGKPQLTITYPDKKQ